MRTHITLRLSDDVLQAVDEATERSGRTRAREIEWNLRMMLLPKFSADVGNVGKLENALQEAQVKPRNGENIPLPPEAIDRASQVISQLVPGGKRRLCKRHHALGMFEDECTGPSCRQDRADRERRMHG